MYQPHLTEKEKKRLKKLNKMAKVEEEMEKVKLGLVQAPAPRITMSNFMKVMPREAAADPSRVEAEARKAVEKRQEEHLKHNEDRKVTGAAKDAKMKRRNYRDMEKGCHVAVFKVTDFSSKQIKFKVDMNA